MMTDKKKLIETLSNYLEYYRSHESSAQTSLGLFFSALCQGKVVTDKWFHESVNDFNGFA